jgi:hypothetical protein
LTDKRSRYHYVILTVIAIILVVIFAHGRVYFGGESPGLPEQTLPRMSSIEVLYFTTATQRSSGGGLALGEEFSVFPETVKAKNGVVPACSPIYLSLLSIPAGWASNLTPPAEEIQVSSNLEADQAIAARAYANYISRYKLTTIFFQTPFLILLLLMFYTASARFVTDAGHRFLLTLGLCFATLTFPFATALNPILPAAALLFTGLHYLWTFSENKNASDGITAGLFIGAAFAMHHLVYVPAVALLIFLVMKLREPERLLPFIGGLVPGVAIFVFANISVFGDPLPAVYHRGGGESGIVLIWQHFIWSLLGYNGALWMAPLTALALIYSLTAKAGSENGLLIRKVIGITACVLLLAVSLEAVFTFRPLEYPATGDMIVDAYTAERTLPPEQDLGFAGFPLTVVFYTKVFGGEALALIGPCLFLMFCGVFITPGNWCKWATVLARAGIFLGIFAAYNPLGGKWFPLVENIYLLGMELALKFPRESIF